MMLGKRMGSGYYTSWNKEEGAEYIERLSKFYDSHEWGHCTDKDVEHQLDCFEITYEHARQ